MAAPYIYTVVHVIVDGILYWVPARITFERAPRFGDPLLFQPAEQSDDLADPTWYPERPF